MLTSQLHIVKLKKTIGTVINSKFDELCSLLDHRPSIESFSNKMFQAGLITEKARDNPEPDKAKTILKEFVNGIKWVTTMSKVEEHCKRMLTVFKDMGGPFQEAATVIRDQWQEEAKKDMDITLFLDL